MRKCIVIAVAVVLMMGLAGSAMAANSLAQGEKAISVGFGESSFLNSQSPMNNVYLNNVVDISGRYFLAKDVALYGGFGLQLNSGDYDGTYFSFTVGARKYLSVNDFAPFVGGQLSYISVDVDGPPAVGKIADATVFDVAALFGAEYFFSKSFSVEGAVGIGLGQINNNLPAAGGGDSTYLGTRTVGVHVNFYF
jgi:hypothetical protein